LKTLQESAVIQHFRNGL